jgi:hypothetical protein
MNQNLLTIFMMVYHHSIVNVVTFLFSIFYIIPVYLLGYRTYTIYNTDTQKIILSKIIYSTKVDENNSPIGYFIGKKCIGHYNVNERILNCICTLNEFKNLTKLPSVKKINTPSSSICNGEIKKDEKQKNKNEEEEDEEEENITIYYKNNHTEYVYYKPRLFNVFHFQSLKHQENVINTIIHQYNESKNKSIVCMLYGEPNSGKTMVSLLLAKKLKGMYCKNFKPTEPGDSIDTLYSSCNPTIHKPLIVLLDEFDIILDKIHHQTVKTYDRVLTQVTDKISWNQLLDNISIGFYPCTIFILTTNLTPCLINEKFENSYIRKNRCQLIIEMNEKNVL